MDEVLFTVENNTGSLLFFLCMSLFDDTEAKNNIFNQNS